MKRTIFKGMMCLLLLGVGATSVYAQQQQRKDTLVVARDGTGEYRNIQEAVEAVRAFMDYTVTIYIKNGIYKEKLVIPSWVKNVQLVGESAEKTIITYDDHANINKMGTFRTYTVKVEGNDITFKDLTIENNAAPLGQAVALHTEGDRLMFVNCRLSAVVFWEIRILFIQEPKERVSYSQIAISRELPILFLVLPPLYSNIANCIVNVIRISLPLPLLKVKNSVMYLKTVS